MRINSLRVTNFRAIRLFEVDGLRDLVVVAGPNGCGKSCLFDALRLLKSTYGGYYASDESRQWFNEFKIPIREKRPDFRPLFRDATKALAITAGISFNEAESEYLQQHAESVLAPLAWRAVLGREVDITGFGAPALADELRRHEPRVLAYIDERAAELRSLLDDHSHQLSLSIDANLHIAYQENVLIETLFQTYDPVNLGVIDFHSSNRTYEREDLGGIQLRLHSGEDRPGQHALYNWQQKYRNIKSQLAGAYVRDLISAQANPPGTSDSDPMLTRSVQELFHSFFPDKTFDGPHPRVDGGLEFPVRLPSGEVHDIDDLSSGEKELVYGYLHLRNSAPQNSIILVDEPELHLNPALLQGLPDFYHRHLGRALDNQLWLVTHSDALLREAVGNVQYSVFHMSAATNTSEGENQAREVLADSELESATLALVGDLATYRPKAKVVIFEGGGDSDFDVTLTRRLFPDFARRVNLISGGSKQRVRDLYEVLDRTAAVVGMAGRFFAVLDRDAARASRPDHAQVHTWDVYHIENYLLEPRFIKPVVDAVAGQRVLGTLTEVEAELERCAREVVPELVRRTLQQEIDQRFTGSIRIGASPDVGDPVEQLLPSVTATAERLAEASDEVTDRGFLKARCVTIRGEFERALADGRWIQEFPGRLVLQRFAGRYVPQLKYSVFRNLLVDRMAEAGYKPLGMESVLRHILEEAP